MIKMNAVSRRSALLLSGAGLVLGGGPVVCTRATPENLVVETTADKVCGTTDRGVMHFLGIPYGGPTGGENRWMASTKPVAWTDERDTSQFISMCPQVTDGFTGSPIGNFIAPGQESTSVKQAEDCLALNVWPRGFGDNGKHPVMVFFHGGGFAVGSSNSAMYDGTNRALNADVVTVTINHRLNAMGYLWLGDIGWEKYANSANSGVLDLVASLEWGATALRPLVAILTTSRSAGNPGAVRR